MRRSKLARSPRLDAAHSPRLDAPLLLCMLGLLTSLACSPVNGSRADSSALKLSGSDKNSTPDSVQFSNQHQFVVKMNLLSSSAGSSDDGDSQDGESTTSTIDNSSSAKLSPQVGQNHYQIIFARGDTLGPVSEKATLTVQFEHSSAKIVKLFPAVSTRQDDGSYLCDLTFKQHGTWHVHLQMTDKELSDEALIEIKL